MGGRIGLWWFFVVFYRRGLFVLWGWFLLVFVVSDGDVGGGV